MIRQHLVRESESLAADPGYETRAPQALQFSQVWGLFSLERKVLLAGLLTVLLEFIASQIRARRNQRKEPFGATLSRPTLRRYWYARNKRRPSPAFTIPCLVAVTYLVSFTMVRMGLFGMLLPQFSEAFFTDSDNAGISLSWMLNLVNLVLLTYLTVSIFFSLLTTSAGNWQERFLLLFAATILVTSRYTVF